MTDNHSFRGDIPFRVLLVEDDEDDYVLVRDMLSEAAPSRFDVEWVESYEAALDAIARREHDVCLVDYRIGARTGLDLLTKMNQNGCNIPVILLTGQGGYDVDLQAMQAGAKDFLPKDRINPDRLERSIRYAVERGHAEEALRESERQLRQLSAQLITVQENERKRISRELHDNIGAILSAVKYGVENALKNLEKRSATPEMLQSLIPMIQHGVEEVRRMHTSLRPSLLDDLGILATINWFCREFEKIYSDIHVVNEVAVAEEDVPEPLKIVIYRIIQEAMNNIAKHGGATRVHLALKKRESTLELTIGDNGVGFSPAKALSTREGMPGLGLASMRERTELFGGFFSIVSKKGSGTTVHTSWPLASSTTVTKDGAAADRYWRGGPLKR